MDIHSLSFKNHRLEITWNQCHFESHLNHFIFAKCFILCIFTGLRTTEGKGGIHPSTLTHQQMLLEHLWR